MKWLGRWIISYPKAVIAITIVMTAIFAAFIPKTTFNNDSGDFIPPSDPERQFNEEMQRVFGNDEIIYIGMVTENVYAPKTLQKVAQLTALLEEIEGVKDVDSLATIKNIEGTEDGMEVYPFVDEDELPQTEADGQHIREQIEKWDVLVNNLVSADGKATSLVVKLNPNVSVTEQERVYDAVKKVIDEHTEAGEAYYFSGATTINVLLGKYMLSDIKRLLPVAFLIVSLFLWLSFRTVNGVVLPLLNVGLSVIWTVGAMAMFKVPLSLPCTSIPVILVSVGTAYAIHIINDYYDEMRKGTPKDAAFLSCFEKIGSAVIMAGLTSVAGFATLVTTAVIPIKHFGIFTAFGTFVALVLAFSFIPAILYLEKPKVKAVDAAQEEKKTMTFVQAYRQAEVSAALRYQWGVVALLIAIVVIAAWGTSKLYVDDNGIAYFKAGTKVRDDDAELAKHFGGMHLFSVIVTGAENDSMKEPIILRNMEGLQRHIQDKFDFIGKTMSLADYIKKMNMAMNENRPEAYTLPDPSDPEGKNLVAQYLLLYTTSGDPTDFDAVVDYDYKQARMIILSKDGSTIKTKQVIAEIEAYVAAHFDKRFTVTVTGSAYTPIVMDRYVVNGQISSVVSSVIAVWLLCTVIFRSAVGGVMTIIPLSVSVLISFASMGFLKIPLEIGTSIVANAAVGIGVDYAIHFLTRFRYEMLANKLPLTAKGFFRASFLTATTSGQAILFNAVSVAAGFLVMMFSSFMPLVRLGALVAAVMFTSSVGSIVFLPVILSIFKPKFITKPASELGI